MAKLVEKDPSGPDEVVMYGRLKNFESQENLEGLLRHLDFSKHALLIYLIRSYPCLFGETRTCTNLLDHDIEMGNCKPVRQMF